MAKHIQDKEKMVLGLTNQLVLTNNNNLTLFQTEVKDILAFTCQNTLKFGGKVTTNQYGRNEYSISFTDLLDSVTEPKGGVSMKTLEDGINALAGLTTSTYDTNSFTAFAIFPSITANFFKDEICFTVADILEESFKNGNTIIQPKESDIGKKCFTLYDLIDLRDMNLSLYTRNFFKVVQRYLTLMELGNPVIKFSYSEFRGIVGLDKKYSRIYDFKTHVLDSIKNELLSHGIEVEFETRTFKRVTTSVTATFKINKKYKELCSKYRTMATKSKSKKTMAIVEVEYEVEAKEEILNTPLVEFQQENEDGYVTPKIDDSMESFIRYKKEMAEKQNKSMKEV